MEKRPECLGLLHWYNARKPDNHIVAFGAHVAVNGNVCSWSSFSKILYEHEYVLSGLIFCSRADKNDTTTNTTSAKKKVSTASVAWSYSPSIFKAKHFSIWKRESSALFFL